MKFVSLTQARVMLATMGSKATILFKGQPGIGKSALRHAFDPEEFLFVYLDCARLMDSGDFMYPIPIIAEKRIEMILLDWLRMQEAHAAGKKLVIMLDELGKSNKSVLNTLLTLILEGRVGTYHAPEGSVIFATTNLETDGVGDNLPAHVYNRMIVANVTTPTPDEWCAWYQEQENFEPVVAAWVQRTPQALDCYADVTGDPRNPIGRSGEEIKDNANIFNPTRGVTKHYVSPRSLEFAGEILAKRNELGFDLAQTMLEGTIGAPAAQDMMTFVQFADTLPAYKDIMDDPQSTRLPDGVGYYIMATSLAGRMTKQNHKELLVYVQRWNDDAAKSMFCQMATRKTGAISYLRMSRTYNEMSAMYLNIATV